jgi:hypothetical protein
VFHVKYELGFYIPEGGVLHSHRREKLKSCFSEGVHSRLQFCLDYLSCVELAVSSIGGTEKS